MYKGPVSYAAAVGRGQRPDASPPSPLPSPPQASGSLIAPTPILLYLTHILLNTINPFTGVSPRISQEEEEFPPINARISSY